MNADPPRDKRLSTTIPLARRSGVGIVRRTEQPFADPVCRKPVRHGGSETRRNPPLQLSQIPYAVTTRLLHTLRVVPIDRKSVIRTRSCRPSLASMSARISSRRRALGTRPASSREWHIALPDPIGLAQPICTAKYAPSDTAHSSRTWTIECPDLIPRAMDVRRIPSLRGLFSDISAASQRHPTSHRRVRNQSLATHLNGRHCHRQPSNIAPIPHGGVSV